MIDTLAKYTIKGRPLSLSLSISLPAYLFYRCWLLCARVYWQSQKSFISMQFIGWICRYRTGMPLFHAREWEFTHTKKSTSHAHFDGFYFFSDHIRGWHLMVMSIIRNSVWQQCYGCDFLAQCNLLPFDHLARLFFVVRFNTFYAFFDTIFFP